MTRKASAQAHTGCILMLAFLAFLLLIGARPAHAQNGAVLYGFTGGLDGGGPQSRLTPDGAGNFYGTTLERGGDSNPLGFGTVFELSPNASGGWNEKVLYSFCSGGGSCPDGAYPCYSYVIFDGAENLYGTTSVGGAYGAGVVFELSPAGTSWTETVLFSFGTGGSGSEPVNGLIMDQAGNLYGVTNAGGDGTETVYELSHSVAGWTQQILYETASPNTTGLAMDAAGNIFGTTLSTIFELSPNGIGGWIPKVTHTLRALLKMAALHRALPYSTHPETFTARQRLAAPRTTERFTS